MSLSETPEKPGWKRCCLNYIRWSVKSQRKPKYPVICKKPDWKRCCVNYIHWSVKSERKPKYPLICKKTKKAEEVQRISYIIYLLYVKGKRNLVCDMFSGKSLHLGIWFLCLCGESLYVKFNVQNLYVDRRRWQWIWTSSLFHSRGSSVGCNLCWMQFWWILFLLMSTMDLYEFSFCSRRSSATSNRSSTVDFSLISPFTEINHRLHKKFNSKAFFQLTISLFRQKLRGLGLLWIILDAQRSQHT